MKKSEKHNLVNTELQTKKGKCVVTNVYENAGKRNSIIVDLARLLYKDGTSEVVYLRDLKL